MVWASGGRTALPSATTLPAASSSPLVHQQAVGGGEAGDGVDGEGAGHHVLLTRLDHQRLGPAGLPVLDRVVGHQQGALELAVGRVAEEEVGLLAGTAAALGGGRPVGGRGALGGGLAALLLGLGVLLLVALADLRPGTRKGKAGSPFTRTSLSRYLAICLRRPYTENSPVGCWTGPVAASKLGVGGRFTLMGGSAWPWPNATAGARLAPANNSEERKERGAEPSSEHECPLLATTGGPASRAWRM